MPDTDLVLTGGLVVDGTGAEPVRADVAVTAGRITAVGEVSPGGRRIDATGQVVCPGFVDIHTHSDLTLLSNPLAHSKIRQGVTTEVVGNCGLGAAPLADGADVPEIRKAVNYLDLDPAIEWTWNDVPGYLDAVDAARPSVNVATLVGHLPLHAGVMGFEDRAPTTAELGRLRALLAEALDGGAVGLSTGLEYAPLCYSRQAEFVALGAVVAERGGLMAWHMRTYADGLLDSVRQVIDVARRTGVRSQISHLLAVGARNWDKLPQAIALVDEARADGLDVAMDMYPYLAGNTVLTQLLPDWVKEGGPDAIDERLRDPAARARVRVDWADRPLSWEQVTINWVPPEGDTGVVGRTVADIAATAGRDGDDVAMDLLVATAGAATIIVGGRSPDNLADVLRHPATVCGSDGQALDPAGPTGTGVPHPRSYGCFPRLFAQQVRTGAMSLAEAVRKCTAAPAARVGLTDRGVVAPGAAADLVVFDPDAITDRATFERTQAYPDGIAAVVVRGEIVVENGTHTGARPGAVLRGKGATR